MNVLSVVLSRYRLLDKREMWYGQERNIWPCVIQCDVLGPSPSTIQCPWKASSPLPPVSPEKSSVWLSPTQILLKMLQESGRKVPWRKVPAWHIVGAQQILVEKYLLKETSLLFSLNPQVLGLLLPVLSCVICFPTFNTGIIVISSFCSQNEMSHSSN